MITPRLGPLGMNQGTRKPTMPQNTLITMRGTVRPVYAMVAAGSASPGPAAALDAPTVPTYKQTKATAHSAAVQKSIPAFPHGEKKNSTSFGIFCN